jgi:uncharacterized protein YdaU (DUF1376 family)
MPAKHETWMPLYIADYLGDTLHLTTEQHGAYLLLLMAAWKRGGSLPDDQAQLAQIARMPIDRWQTHAAAIVLPFFTQSHGTLMHGRVSTELEAARTNVERKSRAGKAGAAAKWQKDGTRIADAKRPHWHDDAPSPSPSPSTPEGVERTARKRASFDAATIELPDWMPKELWGIWCHQRKRYGKTISEAGARLQIKALATYRDEGFKPEDVIEHSIACGYQGLYPPKSGPGVRRPTAGKQEALEARNAATAQRVLDDLAGEQGATNG